MDQAEHGAGSAQTGGAGEARLTSLTWELDGDVWSAASARHDEGSPFHYRITAGAGAKHEKGVTATVFELGGDGEVVPPMFRGKLAAGSAGLEALKALCQELEDGKKRESDWAGGVARMTAAAGGRPVPRARDAAVLDWQAEDPRHWSALSAIRDETLRERPFYRYTIDWDWKDGLWVLRGPKGLIHPSDLRRTSDVPDVLKLICERTEAEWRADLGNGALAGGVGAARPHAAETIAPGPGGVPVVNGQVSMVEGPVMIVPENGRAKIHTGSCGMLYGGGCTCVGEDGSAGADTPSLALRAPKEQTEQEARAALVGEAKRAYGNYLTSAGLLRTARVDLVAAVLAVLRTGEKQEWPGLLTAMGVGGGGAADLKELVVAVMKEL